jgi:hypothetical protein
MSSVMQILTGTNAVSTATSHFTVEELNALLKEMNHIIEAGL